MVLSELNKTKAISIAFAVAMCVLGLIAGAWSLAQAADYKLGAGDKVRVVVLADPEFSGEYEVDASGNMSVRMIGRMAVLGMTIAQLEARFDISIPLDDAADTRTVSQIVARVSALVGGGPLEP